MVIEVVGEWGHVRGLGGEKLRWIGEVSLTLVACAF